MKSPPPPQLEGKIAQLTTEVRQLDGQIPEKLRTTVQLAQQLGAKLEEVFAELKHGQWERWVHDHFPKRLDSFYDYRKVNKNWSKLEPEVLSGRIKTIDDALKFIEPKKAGKDPSEKLKDKLHTKKKEWRDIFEAWLEDLTLDDVARGEELDDGIPWLRVCLDWIKVGKDEASDNAVLRRPEECEPTGASASAA